MFSYKWELERNDVVLYMRISAYYIFNSFNIPV